MLIDSIDREVNNIDSLGRVRYSEMSEAQRAALAIVGPEELRRVLESALEEPRNHEMITVLAAISLEASQRPRYMTREALDAKNESLDHLELHQDIVANYLPTQPHLV